MAISSRPPFEGADSRILASVLADPCQRRLIRLLQEQALPVTDRDLAVGLAGRADASEDDVRWRLADLRHRYLPKLEAVGWIDRHPEGIVTTARFPFGDAGLPVPAVEESEEPEIPWDALAALYARPRRRHVVSELADPAREDPVALDDLAAALDACDRFPHSTDGDGTPPALVLHHVDLPRLATAGLLAYDSDEWTVVRDPALGRVADWLGDGGA